MLAHSTVAITLDIYSHITPGLQDAAAKSLGDVLPAGMTTGQAIDSGKPEARTFG
jgi:hypothetical protein